MVKIGEPVWYTIYYHLPFVKRIKNLYLPNKKWEKDVYASKMIDKSNSAVLAVSWLGCWKEQLVDKS